MNKDEIVKLMESSKSEIEWNAKKQDFLKAHSLFS